MPLWGRSREAQLPRHLPLPTGPHAVGFQDVMTAGEPDTGTFVRLYYPSIFPVNETINKHELWPVWAEDEYLVGFVKFMQAMLAKWPSWAPRGEYMFIDQMSVIAPVMHIGCTQVWKFLNGIVHCPILKEAPISTEKKWPVIVFSHGMGCSRFAYSRLCTDLASHGFVVAATEHRDGSSCLSFHRGPTGTEQRQWIQHRKLSDQDKEYCVRNDQVRFRAAEVTRTLDLVFDINKGKDVGNILDEKGDLSMFVDRLDLSDPIAAGHSFGGATTLLALQNDSRFRLGLVLDGWLFPLRDENLEPPQPIVFINTESFLNRSNITRMRQFLNHPEDRRMIFIKGSVHQNHIDAPLIFKSVTIKKIIGMHSETDGSTVLDLNNKLMIHFIMTRLRLEMDPALLNFIEHHESVIIEATHEETELEKS